MNNTIKSAFWKASPNTRLVILAGVFWLVAVPVYVFLFEPYSTGWVTIDSDDCIHMLKVMLFPIALLAAGYYAYMNLVTDKSSEESDS